MLGFAALAEVALAEIPLTGGQPTPPGPPGVGRYGIPIYPTLLGPTVYSLAGRAAPVTGAHYETQITLNQAATLLMTVSSLTEAPIDLLFIRPDGSRFAVAPNPFLYTANILGLPFVIYTTAYGDLNQTGWWLVQVTGVFDPPGTPVYSFYVFTPNPVLN